MNNCRKTPLFSCHQAAGAKFTEFGGWEMPVLYSGLVDEHCTVRERAGLFDVSHMGEIVVRGPEALPFLQFLTSNDVSKLVPGTAQYSLLLNQQGGVVDDIIIYQMDHGHYLLCVNAANTAKDFAWIKQWQFKEVIVEDVSDSFCQIALQGPLSVQIFARLCNVDAIAFSKKVFPSFSFKLLPIAIGSKEVEVICARTGYTGEDGFELFAPAENAVELWNGLMEVGTPFGLKPIGLGARDTLRLEVCYPLHGHELGDSISALSSGVGWVVKLNKKEDFIGKEALIDQKQRGIDQRLVGIEVTGKGIVRHEVKLFKGDKEVGWVTSGTKPPTVNLPVGLAIVAVAHAAEGEILEADIRGKRVSVKVIKTPFLKR